MKLRHLVGLRAYQLTPYTTVSGPFPPACIHSPQRGQSAPFKMRSLPSLDLLSDFPLSSVLSPSTPPSSLAATCSAQGWTVTVAFTGPSYIKINIFMTVYEGKYNSGWVKYVFLVITFTFFP
uniref:Uncharacterized protein n=1 Tax=Molossus molossus TaxID=27622 RepID=A0A7J8FZM8_MOLMO|nr:hypothetical protein HJG59_008310 [Molossus molossus]